MRRRFVVAIAALCVVSVFWFDRPASAISTDPLRLDDCVANGIDCCIPACRFSMSGCCVQNSCGLPVAGPSGTVLGRGGFTGLSVSCGSSIEQCVDECHAAASRCNAGCCGSLACGKRCILQCSATESACVEACRDVTTGAFVDGAFFETAVVKQEGRRLDVSGPFKCQEGARATVEVRVTESSTGALGIGTAHLKCAAGETTFTASVRAASAKKFGMIGAATACGAARIDDGRERLDGFQWCRDVILVPEGFELRR